jgi:Holliday junction resolvase
MTRSLGPARERALANLLRADGWVVKGTGDAHGATDLVCLKRGETPKLVQVKANRKGGPYMNFRKAERAELQAEAEQAGAECWLVYWPPDRQPPRWIGPELWPGNKERRA